MKRNSRVAAILLAGLCVGRVATPQSSDITLGISEAAARRIALALPEFVPASSPQTRKAAEEITKTLRNDLAFAGYFNVVNPALYSDVVGSSEKKVLYKEWMDIGAESVVLGKVLEEPGKIAVEGRLYDNKQQQLVMGRRYRGEPEAARSIAHRLGNEIVKQFTGQPGIFQTRIAFVSQVGRGKEIFVMDYDGERIKRLTNNGSLNLNPAWSPDGSEIAFLSYRTGRPELVILSSSGDLRKAYPQQKGELNLAPEWSPDGKKIAFSGSRDGNSEIFVLRVSDGQLTRLTSNPALDTSPSWSPTAREIAFVSDRSGTPQIYLMDAEGTNVRRLTYEGSWNDLPAWSPKGDKIAYCSRLEGHFDLFVRDLATQQSTRLTQGPANNEDPRWAPDGRHLVFASDRSGNYDIYEMISDGSGVRRITQGGRSFNPDWSR